MLQRDHPFADVFACYPALHLAVLDNHATAHFCLAYSTTASIEPFHLLWKALVKDLP